MDCPKCKGLAMCEWIPDALEEEYQWRCLNCGWTAPITPKKPYASDLDSLLERCRNGEDTKPPD